MEKVCVDHDKCVGCGACVAIAPDTFEFNEDGLSSVKDSKVTDQAKEAMETCPYSAISIKEEDSNNKDKKTAN